MQTFVDLDGVLGNFDQHVIDLFGSHPDHLAYADLWACVGSVPDFWRTMPLMHHAQALWAFLRPYKPIILTGCPKLETHYDIAVQQKLIWARQQFGADVLITTCLSKHKTSFIQSADDILIDDMAGNVRRWRKAGARAIRFRNFEQTTADFLAMVVDRK
jgi:5'-nucleotidase